MRLNEWVYRQPAFACLLSSARVGTLHNSRIDTFIDTRAKFMHFSVCIIRNLLNHKLPTRKGNYHITQTCNSLNETLARKFFIMTAFSYEVRPR